MNKLEGSTQGSIRDQSYHVVVVNELIRVRTSIICKIKLKEQVSFVCRRSWDQNYLSVLEITFFSSQIGVTKKKKKKIRSTTRVFYTRFP